MSATVPGKVAWGCRICKTATTELGKCGNCQQEDVCPDCWMTSRCCAQLEVSE
jgi:ATP-dependent helicase YprA (DUF1998 family)